MTAHVTRWHLSSIRRCALVTIFNAELSETLCTTESIEPVRDKSLCPDQLNYLLVFFLRFIFGVFGL